MSTIEAIRTRWTSRRIWTAARPLVPILAGGLTLAILAWAGLFYHLQQSKNAEIEQAKRDVTNLSIALAEQVSRLIVGTDQVMRLMQSDYKLDPKAFDFNAWLNRATSMQIISNQIVIFDKGGTMIASRSVRNRRTQPINVADRPYFKSLAEHPDAGLYVEHTVFGRINDQWAFVLGRRLNNPDGSFAGIVCISLDPDYIAGQFRALDIGVDGSVALFGLDGFVRARTPMVEGMYDRDVTTIPGGAGVFEHLRHAPVGTYQVASAYDNKVRIFGYRSIEGLPLIITVGKSVDEVLADFYAEQRRAIAAGIAATLILVAFLITLSREIVRRAKRERLLVEAHTAIREAEARSRGIFECSTDLLFVYRVEPDRSFVLENMSPLAASVLDVSVEAVRGKRPEDFMGTAAAAEVRAEVESIIQTAQPSSRVGPAIFDKTSSTFEIILVPLFESGDSRRVTRVFMSVRDISHLQAAEEAVSKSEARYRLLADHSSDMISEVDLAYNRLFVSPASRELLGYEPEELVDTRPQDYAHPEDRPHFMAMTETLLRGEAESGVSTHRLLHKDGRWIWVEGSWSLIRGDDGAPAGFVASVRNAETRYRAEEALRTSEARFRLLAENTSELIMLGHDDGRRAYISPASLRLLGFAPDELAAMKLRDYVHPDDLPRLYAATKRLNQGASESWVVHRALHKTKEWLWVEGVFRRIPDAQDGEPTIVATFRDVTERQTHALALQAAKEAAERAQLAAEQASLAKSDFLAAMSHEIRTPLNGVLGYTDILLEDPHLSSSQRRDIERIHSAGAALRTVVDDILDFSKIEAGEISLDPQPFRLDRLADDAISIVRGSVGPKVLEISTRIGADVPPVLVGDEDRLRQILLNLLNNGVKFTPVGSVTLSIDCTALTEGEAALRFAISDTGIGIPDGKRSRLFERFSQVDSSIRRRFGGTGLGLAICKSLVEAMGGAIGVDSAESKGSTFWFTIKLPVGDLIVSRPAIEAKAPGAGRCARILLAEDLDVNQELARAVIEAAGHSIDIVGNGVEAIEAVQTKTYDLVLMDVQMPIMDGVTATNKIRALDHPSRATPIIAMTANVLPAQIALLKAAGMDDHIGKPFKRQELYAVIDRWQQMQAQPSAQDLAPNSHDVIDRSVYDDLADVVGEPVVRRLISQMVKQLEELFGPGRERADDGAHLARDAHIMISTTGSLGFLELSTLFIELESACADGSRVEAVLSKIEAGRHRALREIDAMKLAA